MNDMTRGDLRIQTLDRASAAAWDEFVESCPEATFFHRAGWKRVIEESFGHQCHHLYVERAGRIMGVLPLTHIRSRLFGNALISNAFCVYGGPAALDDPARESLVRQAEVLAASLDVDYLEFRSREPSQPRWACNDDLYVTFRKDMDPDPEKNLLAIPRKQRAMVRKGIKLGLEAVIDDEVDRHFAVYAESVRNLGTPVFAKSYFRNLKDAFGDACEILTVTRSGRPAASVMSFYFRDEVHPYYGGGTHGARALAANDFMYWQVMRRAVERGYRVFDFGRSKRGTGAFAFKSHWGFAPARLNYEYRLFRAKSIPEVNPTNPKYRFFISAWKRLPLPVASAFGPLLSRSFG